MQNRQRHGIPKRATAAQVSTHRAGHSSGIHPEDAPYITAQRQRYPDNPLDLADDLDYPEERTRMPTSARRYITTEGQQVLRDGNRQIVIHHEPPPRSRRRRFHWSLFIGTGMTLMVLFFVGLSTLSSWWTNHQLDATYGYPRTYQMDAVVGHNDSLAHPSHFIFLNLNGHVLIIELPGGDASHAKIYSSVTLFTDNADQVPITGEFRDVNGDGKIDMIVHIGDKQIIYLNDGTTFKPQ